MGWDVKILQKVVQKIPLSHCQTFLRKKVDKIFSSMDIKDLWLALFDCLLYSDPRPTFLIWARGGPVALMRGANRPLLTRLVEQEVSRRSNVNSEEANLLLFFKF